MDRVRIIAALIVSVWFLIFLVTYAEPWISIAAAKATAFLALIWLLSKLLDAVLAAVAELRGMREEIAWLRRRLSHDPPKKDRHMSASSD